MTPLSKSTLRSAVDAIEQDLNAGMAVAPGRFASARAGALHRAKHAGDARTLRRLAKLLAITGDHREAMVLLRDAVALSPGDEQTALLLSDALASRKKLVEALEVLSPCLEIPSPSVASLSRAAKLHRLLGRPEQSLQLSQEAADRDPTRRGAHLAALTAAGRSEEALSKARELLAEEPDDPQICHACYTILLKLGTDKEEITHARNQLLNSAERTASRSFWHARVLRQEGNLEAGTAVIEDALAAVPDSAPLIKERASHALAQGHWGRDAGILLKARPLTAPFSELAFGIAQADLLLRSYGGSLNEAACEAERYAHVKTPECVFERVVRTQPAPQNGTDRSGLVMVVGSLAGGGAERILANTFRLLSQERKFEWTKLYVQDLAHETAKDFYLPLTGLDRSGVVVLDHDCQVKAPLYWLADAHAQVATRILEHLKQDRPVVVHASLEPLNILAGLAAILAGVPRIVLHTHNMRPTDLALRHASRMRDCYRALLKRPEVSLVGCARACVEDYVEWLELEDRSKIHVVHNGLDAEEIIATSNPGSRTELRTAHGIEPGTAVIGTAFRFAEVKQPLLWVDAAAEVLESRPGCRFVMFGDGELRHTTEEYIRAKGLASHFILPGRIIDIYRRLPLLDLFVLSSRTEALPNVLLEAQAAGVPVVAFDVGGVAETMIAEVTGFLVKDHSATALAAGILRALGAPEWRRKAAIAGQGFVREAFSTGNMVRDLSDILLPAMRRSSNRETAAVPVMA